MMDAPLLHDVCIHNIHTPPTRPRVAVVIARAYRFPREITMSVGRSVGLR